MPRLYQLDQLRQLDLGDLEDLYQIVKVMKSFIYIYIIGIRCRWVNRKFKIRLGQPITLVLHFPEADTPHLAKFHIAEPTTTEEIQDELQWNNDFISIDHKFRDKFATLENGEKRALILSSAFSKKHKPGSYPMKK